MAIDKLSEFIHSQIRGLSRKLIGIEPRAVICTFITWELHL